MSTPIKDADVKISIEPESLKKPTTTTRKWVMPAAIAAALLLLTAVIVIPIAWTKTGVFADDSPSQQEIAKLFDQWNAALQTGNPETVADMYAKDAVLLPTVSNTPRNTRALIVDYFVTFLKYKPYGRIDTSYIHIHSPKVAANSGLYTFNLTKEGKSELVKARYTFEYKKINGKWKIMEHHSSAMPEQNMPTEAEIAGLFDQWNAALKTLDPEKVADMYTPDAVLLPTVSNTERTNRTGIVNYFTSFLKMRPQGTIVEQHISMLSPTMAINSGDYIFTVTRDGKEEKVPARFTYVYRKVGDKWLIAQHHSSAAPEQQLPTRAEIAALFKKWNDALKTGDPEKVADRYADEAVLLPTLSNKLRTTRAERIDYFVSFLKKKPQGKMVESHIQVLSSTLAVDDGIYDFTFEAPTKSTARARYSYVYIKKGGEWLILEHHSSAMPEK